MATHASIAQCLVGPYEGPPLPCMATQAARIGRRPKPAARRFAMRIVAVVARHTPFEEGMMELKAKARLLIDVASKADGAAA